MKRILNLGAGTQSYSGLSLSRDRTGFQPGTGMTDTYKKTAVVDFDNTISGYDKWRGEDVLGPIVPFAIDALEEIKEWGWRVVVFTTRGNTDKVKLWLTSNGLGWCEVNSTAHNPPGTSHKPIGEVYFDDRDAHCVGTQPYNWHRAMSRVRKRYRPRLDTYIDDAMAWSHWSGRLSAFFRRRDFRKDLPRQLDLLEDVGREPIEG